MGWMRSLHIGPPRFYVYVEVEGDDLPAGDVEYTDPKTGKKMILNGAGWTAADGPPVDAADATGDLKP
jgi:hypothetical protein